MAAAKGIIKETCSACGHETSGPNKAGVKAAADRHAKRHVKAR